MSILKTIYLQHLNGGSPNATLDANGNMTVTGTVAGAYSEMFRNRIINGDMRIDQRATSITAIGTANYYTVDRWRVRGEGTDGVFTAAQSSNAPTGFKNSLLITVTTADASIGATQMYGINQLIEGYNVADLDWGTANAKTVTLSFWVRSSLTGTFGGSIRNNAGTSAYPFTYTIFAANTWEYKTVTIPGDTNTGSTWETTTSIGLWVNFSLGVGSDRKGPAGVWNTNINHGAIGETSVISTNGATFYLTGVQLEVGTIATPFERRPYGTELALCQRYCQIVPTLAWSNQATSTWNGIILHFKVTMRAAPTVTLYSTNTGASGKIYYQDGGVDVAATALPSPQPDHAWLRVNNVSTNSGSNMFVKVVAEIEL